MEGLGTAYKHNYLEDFYDGDCISFLISALYWQLITNGCKPPKKRNNDSNSFVFYAGFVQIK